MYSMSDTILFVLNRSHNCLLDFLKMEIADFVNAFIASLSRFPEGQEETETVVNETRVFVMREDFPSKSQIEEEVLDSDNSHTILFNYAMILNLWNAFKKPTMVEVFIAIREVGHMSTSREEMSFNVSLIHFIFKNEDLFDSECGRNNLPGPAVRYCKGIISSLWEGIHGWEN